MPTNKQRREAARRHLERQLQRRQEREIARRRFTLIASIVGTLVLIAVIVMVIVFTSGDNKKKTPAASKTTPTTSATPSATPSVSYPPATGPSVTFDGVTVKGAADLAGVPAVTAKGTTDPAKVEYKDLVVGTGAAAQTTSTVTVQYVGVLYKGGTKFDSSWDRGMPADFPLNQVVQGFTQGIAGTTGIPPMKVGGRRIIIMPSKLAYGASGQGTIPANAPLVFVVDLTKVSG